LRKRIGVKSSTFLGHATYHRSRDHLVPRPYPIGGPIWNQASISRFPRYLAYNGQCDAMVGMTLIRPLNKGQGHSFW